MAAATLTSALSIALTGCGSDAEEPGTDGVPAQNRTPTVVPGAGADPAAAGVPAGGSLEVVRQMITLAETSQGGTAIEVELEADGTWEVELIVADQSVEVMISADGTQILGSDPPEPLDAGERSAFETAKITLDDALVAGTDEEPGTIDEAELTSRQGQIAYQVEIYGDAGKKIVYVDAVDGSIVEVTNG